MSHRALSEETRRHIERHREGMPGDPKGSTVAANPVGAPRGARSKPSRQVSATATTR